MPKFVDLADREEDFRIDAIGRTVTSGKTIAFIVEDHAKAGRYIRKLAKRFPDAEPYETFIGPTSDTVTVKVRPRAPESKK